ncbi:hypothetical protein RF11_04697 [Thelohanellus kitauei]|uniref:Uncharacterized protein n=1 Tax=Thelohanellus kitauei TaxID=669202 RepID=A0A0C2NAA8_THEKT|nr:hypothetical protein RF11_04697 [Thelohanellus kitauei]
MDEDVVTCFLNDENQRNVLKTLVFAPERPKGDMFYFDMIITIPNKLINLQNPPRCGCPPLLLGPRCQYKKKCANCAVKNSSSIKPKGYCRTGWTGGTCDRRQCYN